MRNAKMAINPNFQELVKTIENENPSIAKLLGEKIDWIIESNLATLNEFHNVNSRHLMVAELVINDLLLEIRNLNHSVENLMGIVNAKIKKES